MKQKYQQNIYSMYTVNPLLNGSCLKSLQYNLQPGILHDDTLYTREQNIFFDIRKPILLLPYISTHLYLLGVHVSVQTWPNFPRPDYYLRNARSESYLRAKRWSTTNLSRLYILAAESRWWGRAIWRTCLCFSNHEILYSMPLNHFITTPSLFSSVCVSPCLSLSPSPSPHFPALLIIVSVCARLYLILMPLFPLLVLALDELRRFSEILQIRRRGIWFHMQWPYFTLNWSQCWRHGEEVYQQHWSITKGLKMAQQQGQAM